jgi:hypothetical protein
MRLWALDDLEKLRLKEGWEWRQLRLPANVAAPKL